MKRELPVDVTARFWRKVDEPRGKGQQQSGCWVWQSATLPTGYGYFFLDGHGRYAHRLAYEMLVGPVPKGLLLHHKCENPACVNPAHLQPVTHSEHHALHPQPRPTRCPRGHLYEEHGRPTSSGGHQCRVCDRERKQKWRDENREEWRRYDRERKRRIAAERKAA